MRKKIIKIAQKAVWDIEASGLESMPLAAGYLKANALKNIQINNEASIEICNFGGAASSFRIMKEMFLDSELPDVIACSVYGWNLNIFGSVAETFRQFNPNGWVIFGGPHVTNQAERVFSLFPSVDIVVNFEGEVTFSELIENFLNNRSKNDLFDIKGISFKTNMGHIISTEKRKRLKNLDDIPSPFLSGAIPLQNKNGIFRYDVALMETNRGCPNNCAFCFWGGATGENINYFSIDRLTEEVELFGKLGVREIVLCDANFGMNSKDEEFIETVIRAKEKYGFPKRIITSWVKTKRKSFYNILDRMNKTNLSTSFSLSLQSLHLPALELMGRKNMDEKETQNFLSLVRKNNIEVYSELLWGLPGETSKSFIKGYDKLAKTTPRIAIYPLLLIPNTRYFDQKDLFGIKTCKAGKDDFEYVLEHDTMSYSDNHHMQKFIFFARLFFEYPFFRYIMHPLRFLLNISQSDIIFSLDAWVNKYDHKISRALISFRSRVLHSLDAYNIEEALHYIYNEDEMDQFILDWWENEIISKSPSVNQKFLKELIIYDLITRPIYRTYDKGQNILRVPLNIISFGKEEYYVKRDLILKYDFDKIINQIINEKKTELTQTNKKIDLYYKTGFSDYISNHEFYNDYCAKTIDCLRIIYGDKDEIQS